MAVTMERLLLLVFVLKMYMILKYMLQMLNVYSNLKLRFMNYLVQKLQPHELQHARPPCP